MSVMVGLLEGGGESGGAGRRREKASDERGVEEAGWEVVRRAEGVEVKKEKKEEWM